MTQLTLEAKEAVVAKALARGDIHLKQIASDCGVGYSTLQSWLRLKKQGLSLDNRRLNRSLPGQDKIQPLTHLIATASLDEEARGVYCREQGIYSFQLKQWRDSLMTDSSDKENKLRNEMKALRKENEKLKKDLHRKDKALAETSALLVLKKKADLIWGDLEGD